MVLLYLRVCCFVCLMVAKNIDAHGHSHGHDHDDHDHGHHHHGGELNVKAVCLHYLGDMVSSLVVLVTGFVILLFDDGTLVLSLIDPVCRFVYVF